MVLPIPDAMLPAKDDRGAFWADRGDRRHCGIDLFAAPDTPVFAMLPSRVAEVRLFTGPGMNPYWFRTYQVLVENEDGTSLRYAELGSLLVEPGARLNAGASIGHVVRVINASRVDDRAPSYIWDFVQRGRTSMFHLERWQGYPRNGPHCAGGNWLGSGIPDGLLDPITFLQNDDR